MSGTERIRAGADAHIAHLENRFLDRGHAPTDHLLGRRHVVEGEHMNVAEHPLDAFQLLSKPLGGRLLAPSVKVLTDERRAEGEHNCDGHPHNRGQRPVLAHVLTETINAARRSCGNRLAIEIVLEIFGKSTRTRIAPLRVFFETGRDDGFEVCGNPPVELAQGSRFVGDHLHQGFDPRRAGKRRFTRDQVIQRRTDPVHVHPPVDQPGISLDLLGRHVGRCADDHSHQRHTGGSDLTRDPEIENIGVQTSAVPVLDHDVARLDVAVNHPHRMGGLDRLRDLLHHHDPLFEREIRSRVLQRSPVDELHRNVGPTPHLADLVNPAHVVMLDLCVGTRLALKPVLLIGIVRVDELDCDLAAEAGIDGAVNEPHGALTEVVDDGVAIPVRDRIYEDTRQRLTGSGFGGHIVGRSGLFGPTPVKIAVPHCHTASILTRNDYELSAMEESDSLRNPVNGLRSRKIPMKVFDRRGSKSAGRG